MRSKKTKYCEMILVDGIVYLEYHENDLLELEVAKDMVEDRIIFCEGVTYPHLFDFTKVKKFTKQARDYFANEGNDLVSASALLIDSQIVKMMANFFIVVNKPKNPTKMFTDKDLALKWLDRYKNDGWNTLMKSISEMESHFSN